jgi:pimeloyl-ACP methyl ester carboxylesterase
MDVLLIHGTTQSPAGWDLLSDALVKRGHRVHLVDLPSDQPEWRADDYAALAAAQAPDTHAPVLVAHSAAGLLMPAIATRLKAARMVWLAATVPDPGGLSFTEEARSHGAEMFTDEWRTLTEPPTADPVTAAYFLFHDCDLATVRWALATVRLFYPAGAYAERMPRSGDCPPSTFILPRDDRAVRAEWMRRTCRERLDIEPIEVDGGHCPHVSRPDEIAEIIDRSVERVPSESAGS